MLNETYIELIEFFKQFIWILNGATASLLLLALGVAAWLSYAESRRPVSDK